MSWVADRRRSSGRWLMYSDARANLVEPAWNRTRPQRDVEYRCKNGNHLTRNAAHVDNAVFASVLYALTHPRAYELLQAPAPDVDRDALYAERKAIRTRLEQMAEDEVLGLKTRAQVIAATKRANARIGEIDELLNATVTSDPLAAVINAADPVAAWDGLELADQRLFIERLCTVTILPAGRKGRGFDPTTLDIVPKHGVGPGQPAHHRITGTGPDASLCKPNLDRLVFALPSVTGRY